LHDPNSEIPYSKFQILGSELRIENGPGCVDYAQSLYCRCIHFRVFMNAKRLRCKNRKDEKFSQSFSRTFITLHDTLLRTDESFQWDTLLAYRVVTKLINYLLKTSATETKEIPA